MGVCGSLRGIRTSSQNRALAWSFCPNTGLNSACNLLADGGFVDSTTPLAPQWGSAVHFGGPKIRARIALSFGAVRSNTCSHSRSWRCADAEFVDSITLLAPPWGSAVHFGGAKIRARIALPFGAVRPKSMVNLHCNHHAHAEFDDSITLVPPPWGSAVDFGGAKIRAKIALSCGAVRQNT